MSTDNTRVMQEALAAAVARMNNGGGMPPAPPAAPTDTMGLLAALLPRLLNNQDEGAEEDLGEKIDTLQKEDLAPLRVEVQTLRKQLHQIFKMQQRIVGHLQALDKRQAATSSAVLDLAAQMARVEIIPELPEEDDAEDGGGGGERAHQVGGEDAEEREPRVRAERVAKSRAGRSR